MQKLTFAVLFVMFLAFSPAMSMTQSQDTAGDWLSILTEILSDKYVKSKMGSVFNWTPLKPDPAECQVCTMYVGTAVNYAKLKNITIDDLVMNKFCPMFPTQIQPFCKDFIKAFGPIIVESIKKNGSPDQACRDIGVCNQPQCNLFPKNFHGEIPISESWIKNQKAPEAVQHTAEQSNETMEKIKGLKDSIFGRLFTGKITVEELDALLGFVERLEESAGESPFDWIKQLIQKWTGNHTTPVDLDGDTFSQLTAQLRGYNWRGRDCNDNDAKVYPGRKTDPYSGLARDFNCNGIKGHNPKTRAAYKDELCKDSKQMGVVVMGDSAGAHAEIPRNWVDANMWNETTFKGIIDVILNEVDLPHMSGYTGYTETGLTGPVRSVYKYLYERNKCNFRDFQNIAVNGASSNDAFGNNLRLARKKNDDHPLLMFLELIGNDVCDHRHSFDAMTTPENFRKNTIKMLDYLDSVVPTGSHLVILGVVNGSLLYEGTAGRVHPLGITYDQLYDYQNCVESSFCWGWLQTNATIRELTTKRAEELNQVYRELMTTYKPKNFDFAYYDFPAAKIFNEYRQAGNDPMDLIEPVDGFHPSQLFHAKLGDYLWETLLKDHPDWLGPVNPNNDLITQLFGNQGGY